MNRRAITACAFALIFAAMSGKAALAQDRGRSGRDRRPDSTGARPDTTEAANGANAQGGHVTSDADRAIIQADQERQARQAEADRQAAAQGRRPDNQGRQQGAQGRQPGNDQGRQGAQGWQGREAENGANRQGGHTYNEADRQVIQEHEFNNRDRQLTRDWYRQNQRRLGPGWREQDRLSPSAQRRLRRGYRLDSQMRRELHSLPPELSRRYGPAPRGYRYAVIGGNVILLDDTYEVHDVFTLTLTF